LKQRVDTDDPDLGLKIPPSFDESEMLGLCRVACEFVLGQHLREGCFEVRLGDLGEEGHVEVEVLQGSFTLAAAELLREAGVPLVLLSPRKGSPQLVAVHSPLGTRVEDVLLTRAYISRVNRCPYFPVRTSSPKCSTAELAKGVRAVMCRLSTAGREAAARGW
jgi:hypothetical protein